MKTRTISSFVAACCIPSLAHAQPNVIQSDFGGVGLQQIPTARMAAPGALTFNFSRTEPYEQYSVSTQPLSWLELGFRYTRLSGPASELDALLSGYDYLNNGIDAKILLKGEERYWPAIALGFRNLGGSSLFRSEYLVASKRWYSFDFSLGMGWGYLAGDDDIDNAIDNLEVDSQGTVTSNSDYFSTDRLFRGSPALFGGIGYQTPWEPLRFSVEYDANDYKNEPLPSNRDQDSHINAGAHYQLTDNVDMHLGWERGSTLMWGVSLSTNLSGLPQFQSDPPAEPVSASSEHPIEANWQETADKLDSNAGFAVRRITRDDNTLTIEGEPTRYQSLRKSEGRANRILHNRLPENIETFRYRQTNHGLVLRDDVHNRDMFVDAVQQDSNSTLYEQSIYAQTKLAKPTGNVVYEHEPKRFTYGLSPVLVQNAGGPDGYLYQLYLSLDAELRTDSNGWFSGQVGWTLADNLDDYNYSDNGNVDRVRSHRSDYLDESSVGLYNLQYTRVGQLNDNWFVMGYGGILEMMYSGAGGEILYRPLDSIFSYGIDANWVKQRDFDQGFGTRDYDTWTGHATAYFDTGYHDVLAALSVGRYLAKDFGATIDLSREFANGVNMGLWATFTDADDDFDEGDFNRGLYVSLPLDALFSGAGRQKGGLSWQPLTRDSGARLNRRYSLYELTQERDTQYYWRNPEESYE
ncbi:YjbH domain-containing protein [Phytohalomonas tamaricis]|uniref:YjbH domain-containing protein n=1 Tax=Phytohalomonas tamaricis TaxID=2081032 RepID=UPI000D0ABAF1|nr:YjbH domain-containing protein [Phytohalomonas tamaricis]